MSLRRNGHSHDSGPPADEDKHDEKVCDAWPLADFYSRIPRKRDPFLAESAMRIGSRGSALALPFVLEMVGVAGAHQDGGKLGGKRGDITGHGWGFRVVKSIFLRSLAKGIWGEITSERRDLVWTTVLRHPWQRNKLKPGAHPQSAVLCCLAGFGLTGDDEAARLAGLKNTLIGERNDGRYRVSNSASTFLYWR